MILLPVIGYGPLRVVRKFLSVIVIQLEIIEGMKRIGSWNKIYLDRRIDRTEVRLAYERKMKRAVDLEKRKQGDKNCKEVRDMREGAGMPI